MKENFADPKKGIEVEQPLSGIASDCSLYKNTEQKVSKHVIQEGSTVCSTSCVGNCLANT
jgi:hypothetical protein